MKTKRAAISISEETLIQVEEIARELGMQRSQLIATVLAEFVARRRESRVTEMLNAVYEQEGSEPDPVLAKMQFSALSHEDW
jgi:metal-responsive CopG/Arc/MetJ family transcriptional regulator